MTGGMTSLALNDENFRRRPIITKQISSLTYNAGISRLHANRGSWTRDLLETCKRITISWAQNLRNLVWIRQSLRLFKSLGFNDLVPGLPYPDQIYHFILLRYARHHVKTPRSACYAILRLFLIHFNNKVLSRIAPNDKTPVMNSFEKYLFPVIYIVIGYNI